ncbi:MAG: hypothetical protein PWR07_1966 [Bacillota bacterium]|nr:hypothetical protein [Bacillota bacterium]
MESAGFVEGDNEPMMNVVGVRFRSAGKVYYFDPGDIELSDGDKVIVETVRGLECGEVVGEPRLVPDEEVAQPLKKVIRKATPEDESVVEENREKERRAFKIGLEKIAAHGLPMKLVDVEYTFDGSKIIFFFTADGRVDFRELVKDLASVFRTRIELRQIGVRDEAKMLGGLGPCGRPLCCATFLRDFEPVSIRMAKDQNLSLNPAKISGICGRLMCCLKYEHEVYKDLRQALPPVGSEIDTEMGRGKITELDVLKGIASVKMEDGKTVRVDVREQDGSSRYRAATSRRSGPCIPCGMIEKSQAPETEVEAGLEDGHQLEDDYLDDALSLVDRLAAAQSESAAAAAVREHHDTVATDVDEPEGERERGTTPDAQARDATPAGAGVSAEARAGTSAGAGPGPANGDGAVAVVDSGRIRAARARKRRRRAKHGRRPGQPGAVGEVGKPGEVGRPGGSRDQAAAVHARVSPGRRNARRARRAEQPDASGQSGRGQSGQSGRPGKPGKPAPSGTSVRPSPSVQPDEAGQAGGASPSPGPGARPGPGPGGGPDRRRHARRRRRSARTGRGASVTPTATQAQGSAAADEGSVATDNRSDRDRHTGTGR